MADFIKFFLITMAIVSVLSAGIMAFLLPKSRLHTLSTLATTTKSKALTACVIIATMLITILPMELPPVWNGTVPSHRNQYEVAARAYLEGHFDLDYGDMDNRLLEMENPYDPDARKAAGVFYHWDHSLYNGKYYMYFGAVPLFLVFIPYRLVTGMDSPSHRATELFTALFILGLFALFHLLCRRFFKDLPLSVYLLLASSVCVMSVWFASDTPALYCTANTAGLCMEIWSLYCFIKAAYDTERENRAVILILFGSLSGALAFGCRPPVALANLLVIPVMVGFFKSRKLSAGLVIKTVCAFLPYVFIGALIMIYNYVRFGNVLEFGQSYQLTLTDVTKPVILTPTVIVRGIYDYLFGFFAGKQLTKYGAFVTFPILMFPAFAAFNKNTRLNIKENSLTLFIFSVIAVIMIIILTDIAASPVFIERYRMDIYWLLGILTFIMVGIYYKNAKNKAVFSSVICLFAVLAVAASAALWMYPTDMNWTYYTFLYTP